MNTRRWWAAPLIAMIMVLAAGCATEGSTALVTSAPPKPGEPNITVAAIPAVDLAGLYIAQDDGLFAQQGLHVTIEKIPSSQAIIADQLKGQVDISAGSYVAYISAEAAGARFRILAEASILEPGTRVLVTTADSPITTISELKGRRIGVNGANSIGTLLISALLTEHGISPKRVHVVADQAGFPAMPGQLEHGDWDAAFLAEPYITAAGEEYGEKVLADLDQGAALALPVDGYVATRAWALKHPGTAAAFVRAIEQGQAIANSDTGSVRAAIARYDRLPPMVTAAMVLSGYPIGPVDATSIQRVAAAMLQFGLLGTQDATEVEQGTLIGSMVGPGSLGRPSLCCSFCCSSCCSSCCSLCCLALGSGKGWPWALGPGTSRPPKAGAVYTARMADDQDRPGLRHIHSLLARRIRDGEYPAGAKLPTETELAEEFGCRAEVAARALRLLQWDGLARKVLRKGYFSIGPRT